MANGEADAWDILKEAERRARAIIRPPQHSAYQAAAAAGVLSVVAITIFKMTTPFVSHDSLVATGSAVLAPAALTFAWYWLLHREYLRLESREFDAIKAERAEILERQRNEQAKPPFTVDADMLKRWRLAAEQGDAKAQNYLGNVYEYGLGVPQDENRALKWHQLAADQGVAGSQCHLGYAYYKGRLVLQDYAAAVKWYRKSAVQGNDAAQAALGAMYASGKGVPQDFAEAIMWLDLAAFNGNSDTTQLRETLLAKMTPDQINEAKKLTHGFPEALRKQ